MKKNIKETVVNRVNEARTKLQSFLQTQKVVKDAKHALAEGKKYVERQGKELKKLISDDAAKVKDFLGKEMKELDKLQKQIPGEAKKFKTFIQSQGKELEKLFHSAHSDKTAKVKNSAKVATAKAKAVARKAKAQVQLKVKAKKKTTAEKSASA